MKIADLKSSKSQLCKEFDIEPKIMDCIFELIEKGKIAKPIKLFKDCAPKLDVKGPKKFMYLNMGQKSYFLLGSKFPVGTDIKTALAKVKKAIPKAKAKQKTLLEQKEFFLKELDKINGKIKGHASGVLKFAKSKDKICYMAVRPGVQVSGKTKKGTLANDIKNIGYDLVAKSGQIMRFIPIKEDSDTAENKTSENKQNSSNEQPVDTVNQEDPTPKSKAPQWAKKKLVIKTKMAKMKTQLEKLQAKLG